MHLPTTPHERFTSSRGEEGLMLRGVLIAVALVGPLVGTVSCAAPSGYADLVRRVSPSVVTVLVDEERISAADRAAERAERRETADVDPNALNSIIRRLL